MRYQPVSTLFCMVCIYSSCAYDTYVPATQSVYAPSPATSMLKEKNELRVNPYYYQASHLTDGDAGYDASYGYFESLLGDNYTKSRARGGGLNLGYAITGHWAITAGYAASKEHRAHDATGYYQEILHYRRNAFQVGTGYFTAINRRKNLFIEFYAGYGSGKNNIDFFREISSSDMYYNCRINSFYFQPGIFADIRGMFRFGFNLKTSLIRYRDIRTDYPADMLSEYPYQGMGNLDERPFFFAQPNLNIEFPFSGKNRWLKGTVQIGATLKTNQHELYYSQLYAAFGLVAHPLLKR